MFDPAAVAGIASPGFHGAGAPDSVLAQLLQGSALVVDRRSPTYAAIKVRSAAAPALHRVSEVGVAASADAAGDPPASPDAKAAPSGAPIAEVVVTGIHIRGVKAIASPTVTVTQDDLRRDGDATVADALQKLPQVFSGQSTPSSYLAGTDRLGDNYSVAEGVNLRGLGANATLVLMNGRRLAGTGALADFADVSGIPTAAVDHVEVLLDGASAIYGSDAVAGVVNIVMKKDFDGAETSVRVGTDAAGVGTSAQVG